MKQVAVSTSPAEAGHYGITVIILAVIAAGPVFAQSFTPETFSGLRARSIGPAVTSGRIMTIAVDPSNHAVFYVGAASGGVWKTVNGGATWQPVFDKEGSFSIGWVALDPKRPNIVWVGTGERNSQRSVAYGDGVYRSDDGGRSWTNVGLKSSEHIGRIVINPKDPDTVYVAAQGPLWAPGGDRGLYKTTDGGNTWTQVLRISEHTGVTDVVVDPRNPDVVVVAAYQRRRHFFTLIDGGPESAIHRSTDGGKTWKKVTTGLPEEQLGRIGLAISPVNPDVLYANVEAANGKGGIYRSSDNGVTWERRSDYNQGSMYYGDIFADPVNVDRVYVPDVVFQVSDDGGKTLRSLGTRNMHVDNHIIWVDPGNTNHLLVGNDGGLYRSFDRGANWVFFENLPLPQFYDVDVDNAKPFYNVYGGTQDNYSLGGPSRTRSEHGILNEDWFVTQGGDGFVSRVDPEDPDTIYAELQHGVIVRYDKRDGERIGIQPQEEKGGTPLRWNWDAPFIISPHLHTRLYFGSQFMYRSDDKGNSWKIISPDLTRKIDRNTLPVMGRVWGPDAVAKSTSTALYGNLSAIAESPKKEGLLYAGTDDGLIQVSDDGGGHWRKIDKLPGVPADAYIARIRASQHDAGTVYVAAENHQNGDFAPYLLKSTDKGRTWKSIAGDLPARGSTYAIAEDHVDPSLLFAGTEFAAYWSKDGGQHWLKIGGIPTIAVREIAIQKRENDLVLGTFGRGIYIVDDYSPVRVATAATLTAAATLYPVRDAVLYVPTLRYGLPGKAFQGEMLYTAENPPYGAALTYHLKDEIKTLKQKRLDAEKEAEKAGKPIRYPSADELRAEADEEPPAILLAVSGPMGTPVRVISGPIAKGLQRVAWDLRAPAHQLPPNRPRSELEELFGDPLVGPYVAPGKYSVTLSQRVGGVVSPLAGPVTFNIVMDPQGVHTVAEESARWQFQEKLQALRRDIAGSLELANSTSTRLEAIRRALDATPAAPRPLHDQARAVQRRLSAILVELQGDRRLGARSVPTPVAISERANNISSELNRTLARPTTTHEQQFQIASELFSAERSALRGLVETDVPAIEKELERLGAPYTPGRIPLVN
ncbi:MAG: glycosyl hydrolase [Acidobacteria bacterium]|nr:MAG: glycosyl hydrolase [Acidobacteriota bacterium]